MVFICVPCRDEERTIGVLLWKIREVMAEMGRDYEVIVLDDASRDGTSALLQKYKRVMPLTVLATKRPVGYGPAIEQLLRSAAGRTRYPKRDAIVTLQGDFTEHPDHLRPLLRTFEGGADIVAGDATGVVGATGAGGATRGASRATGAGGATRGAGATRRSGAAARGVGGETRRPDAAARGTGRASGATGAAGTVDRDAGTANAPRIVRLTAWLGRIALGRSEAEALGPSPLQGFRAYRAVVVKKALSALRGRPLVSTNGWAANAELLKVLAPFARRTAHVPFAHRYDIRWRRSRVRLFATLREILRVKRISPPEPGHSRAA